MARALLLLTLAMHTLAGQPAVPQSQTAPRPVREVTARPGVGNVEFVSFDFQQPALYHMLTVHYRSIENEPSIGARYGVEAVLGGEEAIATAAFDAIDEQGVSVQRLAMVHQSIGVAGQFEFIGLMTVPAHPFRIVLSGEAVDGRSFRRVFPRLFRPVAEPPPGLQFDPDDPRELAVAIQQKFDELAPTAVAEREALVAENTSGRIVMPRARVSNVLFAPLLSAAGRPLGVRITYDMEFDQRGRYNPELRLFAEDKTDFLIGRNPLRVLNSTIAPVPREAHAPHEEARDIPGLLAHRADFLYEAHTVYRFSLELVPSFIAVQKDRTTPCLSQQRFRLETDAQKAFARMMGSGAAATYSVFIGGTAFEGRIDGFYGEGILYQAFVEEGTPACEESPQR